MVLRTLLDLVCNIKTGSCSGKLLGFSYQYSWLVLTVQRNASFKEKKKKKSSHLF